VIRFLLYLIDVLKLIRDDWCSAGAETFIKDNHVDVFGDTYFDNRLLEDIDLTRARRHATFFDKWDRS